MNHSSTRQRRAARTSETFVRPGYLGQHPPALTTLPALLADRCRGVNTPSPDVFFLSGWARAVEFGVYVFEIGLFQCLRRSLSLSPSPLSFLSFSLLSACAFQQTHEDACVTSPCHPHSQSHSRCRRCDVPRSHGGELFDPAATGPFAARKQGNQRVLA